MLPFATSTKAKMRAYCIGTIFRIMVVVGNFSLVIAFSFSESSDVYNVSWYTLVKENGYPFGSLGHGFTFSGCVYNGALIE